MKTRVSILMGIDDEYAPALVVAVTTLVQNLRSEADVNLFIAANNLKRETQTRLENRWGDRVTVFMLQVNSEKLARLALNPSSAHSVAVHFRVLAASLLPEDLSRIIYLDSDLMVQRDIFELWELDMHGQTVLAVQDTFLQTLPAHCRGPNETQQIPESYFNSGVMVIDLESWRTDGIEDCYGDVFARACRLSRWADQDALNMCLRNRWGLLPPVWNKQFVLNLLPDWHCSPYNKSEFEQAVHDPAVVHFCSATKPWHYFCDHQSQDVQSFRSLLRKSDFGAFLEPEPGWSRHIVEWFSAPHRRLLDNLAITYRARRRKYVWQALRKRILLLAMRYPWTILSVPAAIARDRMRMRLQ